MPQCIDETTASHRPFFSLQAFLLIEAIRGSANGHSDAGEPAPSEETMRVATNLIAEIPFHLLGDPDISPFCGEIHISWNRGPKQVALMCFPERGPLVHYYHRMPEAPSEHDIEEASAERVAHWLRWLRD